MIIAQQVNHITCHMKKTSRQNIIKHRKELCQTDNQTGKLYGMKHIPYKKFFIQVILNQLTKGKHTSNIKAPGLPYLLDHMV